MKVSRELVEASKKVAAQINIPEYLKGKYEAQVDETSGQIKIVPVAEDRLRDLLRETKQWIFKIANSKGKLLVHRDEIAEIRDLIARIEKELE